MVKVFIEMITKGQHSNDTAVECRLTRQNTIQRTQFVNISQILWEDKQQAEKFGLSAFDLKLFQLKN